MTMHCPDIRENDRMSVTQACEALGICRNTLYSLVAKYGISRHTPRNGGRAFYLGKDIMKIWMRY